MTVEFGGVFDILIGNEGNEEELKKIKNLQELGYKIFYTPFIDNGKVEYDLEEAQRMMSVNAESSAEQIFCDILKNKTYYDLKHLMNRFDYNERCKNENAKCTVLFLAISREFILNYTTLKKRHKIGEYLTNILESFTEREIDFFDLVKFNQHSASKFFSDKFFDASMDYIMHVLLMH